MGVYKLQKQVQASQKASDVDDLQLQGLLAFVQE
jgi:hypothetical protein